MLRGDFFKELIGIELLEPLVEASKVSLKRYSEVIKLKSNLYYNNENNISLYQGDFIHKISHQNNDDVTTNNENNINKTDVGSCWIHGDFIFANSTCFSQELMVNLFFFNILFIYF